MQPGPGGARHCLAASTEHTARTARWSVPRATTTHATLPAGLCHPQHPASPYKTLEKFPEELQELRSEGFRLLSPSFFSPSRAAREAPKAPKASARRLFALSQNQQPFKAAPR